MLFIGALAAVRFLYELFFPGLLWLGRPLPAIALATVIAAIGAFLLLPAIPRLSLRLTPLLLNLVYLFQPAVDLVEHRFIFMASLWLTLVLLASGPVGGWRMTSGRWPATSDGWRVKGSVFLLAALLPIYLLTMPHTVGRADTFEFQVVAPQLGIAHPTGYPLYLLLGKLFTLVPAGSVAWRLNVGTAVLALAALIILYQLGRRLLDHPIPALFGAVALGLTPTFWSQAIEAEVYSLHALIIVAALSLMQVGEWHVARGGWRVASNQGTIHRSRFTIHYSLFFLIGLGLTNHLTTLFLLPPAAMTLFFTHRSRPKSSIFTLQSSIKLVLAFLAPLALYAYLPIRWAAVNGEPMGVGRFVNWVIGGRFQGALQWNAWLNDPIRYAVVGRLFLDNWGWINLAVALIGFIYLLVKKWRLALILLVTWLGYTFYNLNYYVPDLAVFLIPAQIVVAVWWMAGVTAVLNIGDWRLEIGDWKLRQSSLGLQSLVSTLLAIPILLLAVQNWPRIDRSQDDGLTAWGQGVLDMPLAQNGAILADSEKIAPLYYLQQAEGMRPDLDIMVLPDEAAYRAELDGRIAAGQIAYLARFLPGLEGVYHLRSVGPLTEVSTRPLTKLGSSATPANLDFNGIQLIGYELEPEAAIDKMATAVTLYWQINNQQPIANNQYVYVRWNGETAVTGPSPSGQHPANNYYPTSAWDPGEIVPDYRLLPHPLRHKAKRLAIQVALAPPFTPAGDLNWQPVTSLTLPAPGEMRLARPLRVQIGPTFLTGIEFPLVIRPQQPLPITVTGVGQADSLRFHLSAQPPGSSDAPRLRIIPRDVDQLPAFTTSAEIMAAANGRYQLIVSLPRTAAVCGWLQSVNDGCVVGEVEISGAPLPAGATNYDDKIALLAVEIDADQLRPGGQLPVNFTWRSLAPMTEDYTVFIQLLDAQDKIVGQIDAWPVQGTYPTSQWTPGQTITDPYLVPLDGDLPAGVYRLQVGWYLLADLRRLPVLAEDGTAADDKLLVPGLVVP